MKTFHKKLTLKREHRRSYEYKCLERNNKVFVGISNVGNTCYCSAVIQALRCCPAFGALRVQYPVVGGNDSIIQVLSKVGKYHQQYSRFIFNRLFPVAGRRAQLN